MPTHSSILAWKIPWTEDPGGLQSMGSESQTHLSTHTHTHTPWLEFFLVMRTFKIYSLGNFNINNMALLIIVMMLYITSQDFYLITGGSPKTSYFLFCFFFIISMLNKS